MDFFEVTEKRRSIRKFKPDPVAREDLKKILEARRLAPSDGNL
jgi:nitroreductase